MIILSELRHMRSSEETPMKNNVHDEMPSDLPPLPEWLYYQTQDPSIISPAARFNPATAIEEHQAWQATTTPLTHNKKHKAIVIDRSIFDFDYPKK